VQQNGRQWNESMARFEEQIRQMLASNRELDSETKRLSRTLRQSHLRGRWGELHLRRLVEMAGMREHVDFDEQVAVAVDNSTLRADMIIHLPDGRNVIVDSKAVMEAHAAAEEADSNERRMELRRQHGQNVFARIQELGRKNYWKFFSSTFDYVVLFLPGDNIYAAALEARPELFDEAVERHVLLASPMTLLALLKTIAHGWAQSATAKEADAIVDLAKTLLERTQVVWEKLSDTGRHLRRTVDSYNGTIASIESRLRPTLQNFSKMKSLRAEEPPQLDQLENFPRTMAAAGESQTAIV
jgi:DNA recombination protein RmuC